MSYDDSGRASASPDLPYTLPSTLPYTHPADSEESLYTSCLEQPLASPTVSSSTTVLNGRSYRDPPHGYGSHAPSTVYSPSLQQEYFEEGDERVWRNVSMTSYHSDHSSLVHVSPTIIYRPPRTERPDPLPPMGLLSRLKREQEMQPIRQEIYGDPRREEGYSRQTRNDSYGGRERDEGRRNGGQTRYDSYGGREREEGRRGGRYHEEYDRQTRSTNRAGSQRDISLAELKEREASLPSLFSRISLSSSQQRQRRGAHDYNPQNDGPALSSSRPNGRISSRRSPSPDYWAMAEENGRGSEEWLRRGILEVLNQYSTVDASDRNRKLVTVSHLSRLLRSKDDGKVRRKGDEWDYNLAGVMGVQREITWLDFLREMRDDGLLKIHELRVGRRQEYVLYAPFDDAISSMVSSQPFLD